MKPLKHYHIWTKWQSDMAILKNDAGFPTEYPVQWRSCDCGKKQINKLKEK